MDMVLNVYSILCMLGLRFIDYIIIILMLCVVICTYRKDEKKIALFLVIVLTLFSDTIETYFITIVFISALIVNEKFIERIVALISRNKNYWKYNAIVPANDTDIEYKKNENFSNHENEKSNKESYNQYIEYEKKSINCLLDLFDSYYSLNRNVKIELLDGRVYIPDAIISTKYVDYIVEVKMNIRSVDVINRLNDIRDTYEKDTGKECKVIIISRNFSSIALKELRQFIYLKFNGKEFEDLNSVGCFIK